jgi:hypothetical protein
LCAAALCGFMGGMTTKPIFPWRYGMFLVLLGSMAPFALLLRWHEAVMAGFDVAALAFILSVWPLLDADPQSMRRKAADNDANRELMLLLTGIVSVVVLVAVGVAVSQHGGPSVAEIALLLVTLAVAWLFSNLVYALHYAHVFYMPDGGGKDGGFPLFRLHAGHDLPDVRYGPDDDADAQAGAVPLPCGVRVQSWHIGLHHQCAGRQLTACLPFFAKAAG